MKGNKVVVKKRGGSLLAFILGILMGIILVIGSVVGVGYYVLNTDLDTLFDKIGVDNGPDENGDNTIINTDPDKGGAETILDLVIKLYTMVTDPANLTIGQIDNLVPAAGGLVDQVVSALEKYVEIDVEELSATKFGDFGEYLRGVIMDIRPSAFLDDLNLGGDGALNQIIDLLLCGVESKYVTDDGNNIPLYIDSFTQNGGFERVGDGASLPIYLNDYAVEGRDGVTFYIYHYEYAGRHFVAEKAENEFTPTADEYTLYKADLAKPSGNYYVDGDGERIYTDPITIGSLIDGGGMGALEDLPLVDLLGTIASDDEQNQKLIYAILGDITVGDFMNGTVDFNSTIQNIKIGDIIQANGNRILETLGKYTIGELSTAMEEITIGDLIEIPVSNAIMVYLGYGITDVTENDGGYTATYTVDDVRYDVTVEVVDGIITSAYYVENGETVYLGTTINGISGVIDELTMRVPIGDLIDLGDSPILQKLGKYTLGNISQAMDELVISDFVSIPADNAILAYLAFGITGVDEEEGRATYKYTENGEKKEAEVILEIDENGYIVKATLESGEELACTNLNGINERIEGITSSVTIGELLGGTEGNKLLEAIGGYTIEELSSGALDNIAIGELIDIPADNAIMAYLAYGITGLTPVPGEEGIYTAIYHEGEEELAVTVVVENGNIAKVTLTQTGEEVAGTGINSIGSRIDGIMADVPIKDLIDCEGNAVLEKLGEFTLNSVADAVNTFEVGEIINIDPDATNNAIMLYVAFGVTKVQKTAGGVYFATRGGETVYFKTRGGEGEIYLDSIYSDEALTERLEGVLLTKVGDQINSLTKEVEIGELVELNGDSPIIEKIRKSTLENVGGVLDDLTLPHVVKIPTDSAILAYIGYGITDLNVENGTAKLHGETVAVVTDESGEYIVSVTTRDGVVIEGTKIDDIRNQLDSMMDDLTIGQLMPELVNGANKDNKIIQLIADSTLNGIGDKIASLTVADVLDIPADSAIIVYLAYSITDVTEIGDGIYTAKRGEDEVVVEVDANGNITAVKYKETGEAVPSTPVEKVGDQIDGLVDNLTIGDLIEVDESNKLLYKLKDKRLGEVGDAIDDLELGDVIDIEATPIMAYLGYGITGLDLANGTAMLGGERVYVATEKKEGTTYITGIYGDEAYKNALAGTKIGEVSGRISGLMDDLTIGEIMGLGEDAEGILNAIKNSTINSLSADIEKLTMNELYADEIYKEETYEDLNGNGQFDEDSEVMVVISAKKRIAVNSVADIPADADPDDYILFNPAYLYYERVGGVDKLVDMQGNERGKLTTLPEEGVYVTYGKANSIWRLLLLADVIDGETGEVLIEDNESALAINDIGENVTGIADKFMGATLLDLDAAGLIDFADSDLSLPLSDGRVLGELTLSEALTVLIKLVGAYGQFLS